MFSRGLCLHKWIDSGLLDAVARGAPLCAPWVAIAVSPSVPITSGWVRSRPSRAGWSLIQLARSLARARASACVCA
eukprot:356285-Chlamydomonas_euryale.AAC.2